MRPLVLVACCGAKAHEPCPAQDLYTSSLFKKSRRLAENHGDWLILSALHGVVKPDAVISPYNVTLIGMPARQRKEWTDRVAAELRPHANRDIVALAGEAYLEWCGPAFPFVSLPLKGLGIGKRLAWLERENSGCTSWQVPLPRP